MLLQTAIPILAYIDTSETIHFYVHKLGFTFHSDWDGYLIFSKDNIQIHLWKCIDAIIPKNTGCYINVNEIDMLYSMYNKQGIIHPEGTLTNKPWNMRQFSILDNSGNIIHFGEEISPD